MFDVSAILTCDMFKLIFLLAQKALCRAFQHLSSTESVGTIESLSLVVTNQFKSDSIIRSQTIKKNIKINSVVFLNIIVELILDYRYSTT